jgi:hypothetical protein
MKIIMLYLAVVTTFLSVNFIGFAQSSKIKHNNIQSKQLSNDSDDEVVIKAPWGYLPPDSKNLPILVWKGGNKQLHNKLHSDSKYLNGPEKVRDSLDILSGGEFAYILEAKNVIVPWGIYDYAKPFGLGRKAIVMRDGKYGIIDEHGEVVLPLDYDLIDRPSQYSGYCNVFVATKGNEVTIFDQNINIVPVSGITLYNGKFGDLIVSDARGKMGRINYDGELTIPIIYDSLYHSKKQYIAVNNGLYGWLSENNDIIKPFEYKMIYTLRDGVAFVNSDYKVGLWNTSGKEVLPDEYEAIYDTWYNHFDSEKNRYIVVKDGKVGTVDNSNNVVIPIIYDGLSGWVEYGPEAHYAKKSGKYGLISYEGEIIIPIEYEYVGLPAGGVVVVFKNGKYGVVSMENKEVLPCIYDKVIDDIPFFIFGGNKKGYKLAALHNNAWSYFDIDGKFVCDIPLDEIQKKYGHRLTRQPSNESYDFGNGAKSGAWDVR